MRNKIVAGNWKMNKEYDEGIALASEIRDVVGDDSFTEKFLIIIPPFIHLNGVAAVIKDNGAIKLGAQNCHFEPSGAYTGEISPMMLRSMGVEFVLVGHSERRQYFNESEDLLTKKTQSTLSAGITPIFCCGEPLQNRENGNYFEYVAAQVEDSLFNLSNDEMSKVILAYEPVWAIGTGKTATSEQAQEMHAFLRNMIAEKFGASLAEDLTILYGGSCNPGNAAELFASADVDGGLIGGASLKATDFLTIFHNL